jgi:hypothetical protein
MAMVPLTLQTALTTIFLAMNDITEDGDGYKAAEMAKAIKTFILTGRVSTTDAGAAPAGSYTGAGVGTMTIDADVLSDDLLTTFTAGYTNDGLADHIATDIDNACSEDGIVKIISTGTVVIPAGGTSPFSGPGEGKFSGIKASIATSLKAYFSAMNEMAAGGNEYYASMFAQALHAYLSAGVINVILKSLFESGAGAGAIA